MNKSILHLSVRMTVALLAVSLFSRATMSAQTVAYDAPVQAGNQGFTGNLGLDFNVNSPIVVSALGTFDSNGDGFHGPTPIQVAIFNRTTMTMVPGP